MGFSGLQEGDWQNLVYSILLLTVLLGGLFLRRDVNYLKVLKYLGIWAAIALAIILLYSFRFEFADLKMRLLGELNPSAAKIGKNGELIINIAQDGHFYLDVKVNGKAVRFMIDTGASEIVLNALEAKRVGIAIEALEFNRVYQTANGKAFGALTTLDEIQVGDIKFYQVPASVNSSNMGISLLGMSFLRQFQRYEFYRDKLILQL